MFGELDESNLTEAERWEIFELSCTQPDPRTGLLPSDIWAKQRPAIMRAWLQHHAGRRPWAWWKWDAPEPRRRLGGTGTSWNECFFKQNPAYENGLPVIWISDFQARYYNGTAETIHGTPIESKHPDGTPRKPGDFDGAAPDPNDPPLFESEPAYLDRLGLLTDDERGKLNPADFEPVALPAAARTGSV